MINKTVEEIVGLARQINSRGTAQSQAAAMANLREIGWQLWAEGGTRLMSDTLEEIDEPIYSEVVSTIDHQWSRIGNESGGIWLS